MDTPIAERSELASHSPREVTPAGPAMPVTTISGTPERTGAQPGSGAKPGALTDGETSIDWSTIRRLGKRYLLRNRGLALIYILGMLITVSALPTVTTVAFSELTAYFQRGDVAGKSAGSKPGDPTSGGAGARAPARGDARSAVLAPSDAAQANLPAAAPAELERTYTLWVVLVTVGVVVVFGYRYVAALFAMRVQNDMRADVFANLLRQSPSYFHEHDGQALTSVVNQWSLQAATGLTQLLLDPVVQIVGIGIVAVTLYAQLAQLSASHGAQTYELFAGIVVVAIAAPFLITRLGRQLQRQSTEVQRQSLAMMTLVGGALASPEEVQALRAEGYFTSKYRTLLDTAGRTRLRQTLVMERLNTLSSVPGEAVLILMIGAAVLLVIQNPANATPGTIVGVALLTPLLMGAVQSLANFSINAQMAWPAIRGIADALDAASETPESLGARSVDQVQPTVEARHVTFSYAPGRLPNVLDDVSFVLPPAKVTGLVAESGAGKTTIFRLLLRFYDPQSGEILLGGTPLREFTLASLRSHVALMTQSSAFFHDTVRENFRVAGAGATDERITDLARQTGLWNLLTREFGDQPLDALFAGERLSGGQRKLFALTRVLLQDPAVVLLDEPTVGMDAAEKAPIAQELRTVCRGRTVVSVEHDIVWQTRFCDHFLVLQHGKIVQSGTSEELLARPGLFRELYDLAVASDETTRTRSAAPAASRRTDAQSAPIGAALALPV